MGSEFCLAGTKVDLYTKDTGIKELDIADTSKARVWLNSTLKFSSHHITTNSKSEFAYE